MNSLNAKRIAALAVSLAMGLAFAGPASFSSIPIINSAGQPVVQIVIGSTAQPSDGVVGANIAAVIGNLAFTSTPITATVGNTAAVKCAVTSPTCTLSNQKVWLGLRGTVVSAGSYSFKALIGSIMNGGVNNFNTLQYSKVAQSGSTTNYAYPQGANGNGNIPITSTPTMTSAFAGFGALPLNMSIIASVGTGSNGGGGLAFSSTSLSAFASSQYWDNILPLGTTQIPGLLSNSGSWQESEFIWLEGFPVFDNGPAVRSLAMLDGAGAYQVVFGKPIPIYTNLTNYASNTVNHATISILGQNWSIFSANIPAGVGTGGAAGPQTGNIEVGGSLSLASSQTPLTTLYVGKNLTAGNVTVVLQDLSYPTSAGISSASLAVYKSGVLTNQTSVAPGVTQLVNATGTKIYIFVSSTFPGLYAYQKWAKVQLFSNVFNVTSGGKPFNNANKQWSALIRWTTNESTPAGTFAANAQLQGVTVYLNTTRKTYLMTPGSSFTFLTSPATWKATFVGESLGTPGSGNTNYDTLNFALSQSSNTKYANPAVAGAGSGVITSAQPTLSWNGVVFSANGFGGSGSTIPNTINETSVTEPINWFSITSGLLTAFTVTSQTTWPSPSSSLQSLNYSLDTYQFFATNTVNSLSIAASQANAINAGLVVNVMLFGAGVPLGTGNYVSTANPLTVTVQGFKGGTQLSPTTLSFSALGVQSQKGTVYDNLSGTGVNVQLGYAVPNGLQVNVYDSANVLENATATGFAKNSVVIGYLNWNGPYLLYKTPQYGYLIAQPTNSLTGAPVAGSANVIYNAEGVQLPILMNDIPAVSNTAARQEYFVFNIPLITNPQAPTTQNAFLYLGVTNQSTVVPTAPYWINRTTYGGGGPFNNALEYISTQGTAVNVTAGFRTERGDALSSLSTTSAVVNIAKTIDSLNFLVGPATSGNALTTSTLGPYTVGQTINIPNETIANVSASCTFSTTSCSVTGLSNLTATASVKNATTSVSLNTAATPLAVLDSNANAASTLILVGSKFVNSVSAQVFSQNPSLASSFGPGSVIVQAFGTNRILVAGYYANQTVTAGNQFIQQLLTSAANGGH